MSRAASRRFVQYKGREKRPFDLPQTGAINVRLHRRVMSEKIECPHCKEKIDLNDLDCCRTGNYTRECEYCDKEFRFHITLEVQGPDKVDK